MWPRFARPPPAPLPLHLRPEQAAAWLAASLTALDPLLVEAAEELEP